MKIRIESYGINYEINADDDINREQLMTVFKRLLLSLGYSWPDKIDDSIYDEYNEVLASGVIESSKKPIDISRMV